MEAVVRVRFPIRPVLAVAVAGLAIAGGSTAMTLSGPVRDAAVAVPQFRQPPGGVPATPSPVAAPTTTVTPKPTPSAKPKKKQPPRRTPPRTTTVAPTTRPAPAAQPARSRPTLVDAARIQAVRTQAGPSRAAGDTGAKIRQQVRSRPLQQILRKLRSSAPWWSRS
jgi:outer membrane biosynthesis protein TonB